MVNFSIAEQRLLCKPGYPEDCVLAVYLFRNPWQQVFVYRGRKVTWFFYHSGHRCFYCRTPENEVRNDWMVANGMMDNLKRAIKYFPDLCKGLHFEEVPE